MILCAQNHPVASLRRSYPDQVIRVHPDELIRGQSQLLLPQQLIFTLLIIVKFSVFVKT